MWIVTVWHKEKNHASKKSREITGFAMLTKNLADLLHCPSRYFIAQRTHITINTRGVN
jgi:hypothetical protein